MMPYDGRLNLTQPSVCVYLARVRLCSLGSSIDTSYLDGPTAGDAALPL